MVNNILDLSFLVYMFDVLYSVLYLWATMFNERHYLCLFRTCFVTSLFYCVCILIKDQVYETFVACLQSIKNTNIGLHG